MILKVRSEALGIIFSIIRRLIFDELKKWKESNDYGKGREESNWREKIINETRYCQVYKSVAIMDERYR